MRRLALALALLAPLSGPALAQDAALLDEARRTVEAIHMRQMMEQTFAALRPNLVQQLSRATNGDMAKATQAVDEVLMPALRDSIPRMLQGITEIYARHFNAEELRGLREFYATPLGVKSQQLAPVLARETMTLTQTLLPEILQGAIERNRDALRARGLTL